MRNLPARPFWADFLDARLPETGRWRSLAWLALYPLAWILLSSMSTSYWFLPAGLRLAVLWQLPRRAWVPMALLECAGVFGYHLLVGQWPPGVELLVLTAFPWLATAAVVSRCRPRAAGTISLGSQLGVLLGCAFVAAIAGAALVEGAAAIDAGGALAGGSFLRIAQSQFTGMLVMAPLLLALVEQARQRGRGWQRFFANGQVLVPGLLLSMGARMPLEHPVAVALALCLSALFWLALRLGWRATSVALVGILVAVCSSGVLMEGWMPPRMQLLLSACAAAAVLLGASTDAMRVQGHALQLGLAQLHRRSTDLADAAKRLVTMQEHERRTLGSELHDVVGQDITAIAIRLRVVERTTTDPEVRKGLHSISLLVNDAHLHLREVVDHMYPAVLDRFGLSRALGEGPLAALAREGGIDFSCEVAEGLPDLPEEVATSIYRICQEVTSNCIRHADCNVLRIMIRVERSAGHAALLLSTADDAGELQMSDTRLGIGLQTIRDRANALGALYQFDPIRGEPRHWLSLPLPSTTTTAAPLP
jgi:two-component system sensor histidine kinase UhpB